MRHLFVCEREAGVFKMIDLAADETRFSRPASARSAAMRICNAVGKRCLKDSDAFRPGNPPRRLAYFDVFRHGLLSDGI